MNTTPIYIALIHHPVLNKNGDTVTTSITNFDIHDLARTSRTYGVKKCFFVTPNEAQQNMAKFIRGYWQEGVGSRYNPDRKEAFENIEITRDLLDTCLTIQKIHDKSPQLVVTSARKFEKSLSFNKLKGLMADSKAPFLLIFGTGWGLAPSVVDKADWVLQPINGPTEYNHLPVRAAVAIILDRLFGK